MAASVVCPSCREPLPERARFCMQCGMPLPGTAVADTEESPIPDTSPGEPQVRWLIPPGTQLNETYSVEDVIGEGGMGVVYRGHDTALDRTVAIKALHVNLLGDSGIRRRFVREADVMRRWNHPNAVGVYDLIETEEVLAIVMEHVDGGYTLEDHLEKWGGPLPWDEIRAIFDGVLDAMEQAHFHGVVHRDLKPQNILLGSAAEGHVPKVADFGIAKVLEGTKYTVTGALLGTTHYMSPEQVTAPETVDRRTDVYALGVTLYRATTGRMPFESDSHFAVMMAHVHQEPLPPSHYRPNVPADFEELILSALAKDADDRPQTCRELRERLESTLSTVGGSRPSVRADAAEREPVLVDSDGHEMLLVPAGPFQMGPSRREVYLDAFYVARHPVTNRQFQKFLEVTGYAPDDADAHRFVSHWRGTKCPTTLLEHPVVFVSWWDVHAYCAWAGRRLLTEAEWEKAARGADGRKYPWGRDEPTEAHANFSRRRDGTTPVGKHPEGASSCGAMGMAGNVWEWCEDVDKPQFYLSGPARNPRLTVRATDSPCVARGGSFLYDSRSLRTYARTSFSPGFRLDGLGFRCAL